MFNFTEITCSEMEEPLEEIAAAKAAGKCGDCYVCCAGYHEQCQGKDFDWYKELEVDLAEEDAIAMNYNMQTYGTIDKPKGEK